MSICAVAECVLLALVATRTPCTYELWPQSGSSAFCALNVGSGGRRELECCSSLVLLMSEGSFHLLALFLGLPPLAFVGTNCICHSGYCRASSTALSSLKSDCTVAVVAES